MKGKKAIIIGSGVAGLASAIRLAVQGFEVNVYEKNETFGGKIGYFEKDGFGFDTGPSLFTQPENIEELFTLAGVSFSENFSYKTLPVACKYFYEDGVIVNAFTNSDKFAEELQQKTGEPENNVKKYLEHSSALYENVGEIFLNHSLQKNATWKNVSVKKALRYSKLKYIFQSLNKLNSKSFSRTQTAQLFNRFGTYNGSSPFLMPGMFSMIAHLEHKQGIAHAQGGMISIAKALYTLALRKGVGFHFNAPVEKIIFHEGRALGIMMKNENYFSDVIVSNVDIYFTYKNLLNSQSQASKILKKEKSSSALVFYWAMNKEFHELSLHNIFFSTDYKAEFYHLFKIKKPYYDPTVYINITSKLEPGKLAPEGKENWFVMINVPSDTNLNWKDLKMQLRQMAIKKISRMLKQDIEQFIESESIMDPCDIETGTNTFAGALYGSSSNAMLASFLRHPNFTKKIKNLYFAGGTVHPGGGIPLCLKSAKIACELIKKDIKHQTHNH